MALSSLYQIQAWLEQEYVREFFVMDYTQKFASHTTISGVQQQDNSLHKKTDNCNYCTVRHRSNKSLRYDAAKSWVPAVVF